MSHESKTTTDHDTIRTWTARRSGFPAQVKDTSSSSEPGVLRIGFTDEDCTDLDQITWQEFFKKFEKEKLAFLYQEETEDGEISRFNKFVERQ